VSLRFGVLFVAAVSACSAGGGEFPVATPATPATPERAPTSPSSFPAPHAAVGPSATISRQSLLIAQMLFEVERARGLEVDRPVPGVFLDRDALIAHVRAHVSRELPPQALRNEGLSLQLLGFVPTRFDYEGAEYEMLQEQLAGYYEPADGTMYMANDLGDDEATATLAHELVHALQDRHWNLERRSQYRPAEGDRAEAVSALAEGDATSAMFDVIMARSPGAAKTAIDVPDETFVKQIQSGVAQGTASEPHVMGTSLAAPYVYGTLFVNTLRRRGGWKAVNDAWDDPPVTTEQILHVDKWLSHEPPLTLPVPTYETLGRAWHVVEQDSEGELGTRIAFEEWLGPDAAAVASAGWGGDTSLLLSDGSHSAFVWRLRYDPGSANEELAARTYDAIEAALDRQQGRRVARGREFSCWERSDTGPIAVSRRGADLIFALGPALTVGPAWASAGTCALARKWVVEIAASAR